MTYVTTTRFLDFRNLPSASAAGLFQKKKKILLGRFLLRSILQWQLEQANGEVLVDHRSGTDWGQVVPSSAGSAHVAGAECTRNWATSWIEGCLAGAGEPAKTKLLQTFLGKRTDSLCRNLIHRTSTINSRLIHSDKKLYTYSPKSERLYSSLACFFCTTNAAAGFSRFLLFSVCSAHEPIRQPTNQKP